MTDYEDAVEALRRCSSRELGPKEFDDAIAEIERHGGGAMAEQQRIANLIALMQMRVELQDRGRLGFTDDALIWMQAEVAKSLGLPRDPRFPGGAR